MRKVLIGGAVLIGLAVGLGAPVAFAQQKTLTVSSWGGAFQKAQREAWFNLVEKELGRHHQGGHHLRHRRHPCAGRLRQADVGSLHARRLHLRDPPEGGQAREVRCPDAGNNERRSPGLALRLLGLADCLFGGDRLAREGVRRQEADRMGRVLGHQEFPRAALGAPPPDLRAGDGADRRRRADGQALSARRRSRVQEARAVEAARAGVVEFGRAVGASPQGWRGRHGVGVERPHPGHPGRARRQDRQDRRHLRPADPGVRLLADPEGRAEQGPGDEGDRDHDASGGAMRASRCSSTTRLPTARATTPA